MLAGVIREVRRLNGLGAHSLAEPFAGGAGASLTLLYREETPEILINDADPAIHDFWWALLNRPTEFNELLMNTRVTMAEWRRQREVYRSSGRVSRLRRGFAAFYLNRCNRSGIVMNGGPIGGVKQAGTWKLNARFNKAELQTRCQKVADYGQRIRLSNQDGLSLIEASASDTFLFIDPPYFHKGPTLYLNALDEAYHEDLAEQLRDMPDRAWALTYDDCVEVRRLYRGWASIKPFSLRYVAAERRHGREIFITPKWMSLPKTQDSLAIAW